jgi:hypothetical protein
MTAAAATTTVEAVEEAAAAAAAAVAVVAVAEALAGRQPKVHRVCETICHGLHRDDWVGRRPSSLAAVRMR